MSETVESVRLPRVVVTARAAEEIISVVSSASSAGTDIIVYARAVAHSSMSFADQLVSLLKAKGYRHIIMKGASQQLRQDVQRVVGLTEDMSLL